MTVAKVIEIKSRSKTGFEDAVRTGLSKAAKSLDNVSGAWVNGIKVSTDGKVLTPQPKMPSAATRTTMGGATGESMSLLNQTRRPGVIGALIGAIALVGLIIVMVMVKRGNESTAATTDPTLPPPAITKKPEPKSETA